MHKDPEPVLSVISVHKPEMLKKRLCKGTQKEGRTADWDHGFVKVKQKNAFRPVNETELPDEKVGE